MNRLFLFVAALALFAPATARAIDCAKAASPTEKLICANPQLMQLDAVLNKDYPAYAAKQGKDAALKSQADWLAKTRDACADVACLEAAYKKRIGELSGATEIFVYRHVAPEWDVIVSFSPGACDSDEWDECGAAAVDVFTKDSGDLFQRIETEKFNTNGRVVANDFNFDGHNDLALCTSVGSGGSSESQEWSYDIYLYDTDQRKFVRSKEFTDISDAKVFSAAETKNKTLANMEMDGRPVLFIDAKNKTLTRYENFRRGLGNDGHEHHARTWRTYQVRGNIPVLVRDVDEDTTVGCGDDGDCDGNPVVTTTKTLVDGKWQVTTKRRVAKE